MLRGIDPRVPPDLLRDLALMGHYETVLVADGNFPAGRLSCPRHFLTIGTEQVVEILLGLMPIETGATDAVVTRSDTPTTPLNAEQRRVQKTVRQAAPGFEALLRPSLEDFAGHALGASVAILTPDPGPSCYVLRRGVLV